MNDEEYAAVVDEALLTLNNALISAETEIKLLKDRCKDNEELIDVIIARLEKKNNEKI